MPKPGPKTPWQRRAKYQRARCLERQKPCQGENLAAADAFARAIGRPLNHLLTIKFHDDEPRKGFAQ